MFFHVYETYINLKIKVDIDINIWKHKKKLK
jgi:hypothetical protein